MLLLPSSDMVEFRNITYDGYMKTTCRVLEMQVAKHLASLSMMQQFRLHFNTWQETVQIKESQSTVGNCIGQLCSTSLQRDTRSLKFG